MKNKIIFTFLIAFVSVFGFIVISSNESENVNAEGYIEIKTIEDLYRMKYAPKQKYKLMNDLDFNDRSSYENPDSKEMGDLNGDQYTDTVFKEFTTSLGWQSFSFLGEFDGDGHLIKNLYSKRKYASLFGVVSGEVEAGYIPKVKKYAEVKNLGLVGADLYGTQYAAGIAMKLVAARVYNSFVDGKITGPGYWNAGIAAETYVFSIIENTYVSGEISGIGSSTYAAGLVGTVYGGTTKISNNYVTATITGINRVSGIVSQVVGAATLNSSNNIQFSDYIFGEYNTWRNTSSVYSQDYSLFSRVDTRIDIMSSNGDILAEYDPSTGLESRGYDEALSSSYNRFEGLWLTYEDFKNVEFYANTETVTVNTREENITVEAGFTEKCSYSGNEKTCGENGGLTENQNLYYQHTLWDFENVWEILDGADRPTLRVFNKEEQKDDGILSKAPIAPKNLSTNLTTYQLGDEVVLTWDAAYLVVNAEGNVRGLLYDVYFSVDNMDEKQKLNTRSIYNYTSLKGQHSVTVKVPIDQEIDSSNVIFYVVAKNGELDKGGEATDFIISNTVAVDSQYPQISAQTVNGMTAENNGKLNDTFSLKIIDATKTFVQYSINGGSYNAAFTNTEYTEEGQYSFKVRDQFGNESTFELEMSKVKSDIKITAGETVLTQNSIISDSIKLEVSEENLTLSYIYNDEEEKEWTSGTTFEEDGVYRIKATNDFGNVTEYYIVIDKELPALVEEKVVDENYELTFTEVITDVSFDGENWIKLNSTKLLVEKEKLDGNKIYLMDAGGSTSIYDFGNDSNDNSTLEFASIIVSGVLSVLVIGAIVFVIVSKRRTV